MNLCKGTIPGRMPRCVWIWYGEERAPWRQRLAQYDISVPVRYLVIWHWIWTGRFGNTNCAMRANRPAGAKSGGSASSAFRVPGAGAPAPEGFARGCFGRHRGGGHGGFDPALLCAADGPVRRCGLLRKEFKQLQTENVTLTAQYEQMYDLATVKETAEDAGMAKPSSGQIFIST